MLDPKVVAIPLYLGLMAIEFAATKLRPRAGDRGYDGRDSATSIIMGLGSLAIGALYGVVQLAVFSWVGQFAVADLGAVADDSGTSGWLASWALLFLLVDFCYYWFHRLHHEVRFFWAAHVTHHSSQYYNLSTAVRQSWTPVTATVFYLPIFLLGFQPWQFAFAYGWNLIYQFWIHTERIGKMPRWFEFVFNTPSHHRVHHGSDNVYLDKNYGGILILFDRLFGSFQAEAARPVYGLTKNINSYNPVYVAWHEFAAIGRDLRRASGWRERWVLTFGRPVGGPAVN
jgi:sterol desaturase/sphingolipid hydroxylase (fatty acid hydroxylase superfamily)